MILAVSEERMVITKDDLTTGLKLLDWVDERAFDAFRHVDLSHLGRIKLKIIELLTLAGGRISRRDVLRKIGGQLNGMADLETIQQLMEQSGELVVAATTNPGKQSIMYYLPKKEEQNGKQPN
jgi:hypothetical protein